MTLKLQDARIVGRRVAFDQHRHVQGPRRRLDGGDQIEIILGVRLRRHENMQPAAARLDAQGACARCVQCSSVWLAWPLRLGRARHLGAAVCGYSAASIPLWSAMGLRGANGSGSMNTSCVVRRFPRKRIERQAIADRRIAGHQEQRLAAQHPLAALPAGPSSVSARRKRQRIADDFVQALLEDAGQARRSSASSSLLSSGSTLVGSLPSRQR